MNLELSNLTEEQKKQIIELTKKFEQENEVDKLDYENDWVIAGMNKRVANSGNYMSKTAQDFFDLGLTAHTQEDAEKIRRRLLVEKELRDWAKKCKKPVRFDGEREQYYIEYVARYRDWETDRKSTRLNSSHSGESRMPSSA